MSSVTIQHVQTNLGKVLQRVQEKQERITIRRGQKILAELIPAQKKYSSAKLAEAGKAFDFLASEPDLYSKKDLKHCD